MQNKVARVFSPIFCGKRHLLEFLASGGRLSCHFWSTVTHCDTRGRRCMGYSPCPTMQATHSTHVLTRTYVLVSQKYTNSRLGYPPSSYKQHTLQLRTKRYEHMYIHILKQTHSHLNCTVCLYMSATQCIAIYHLCALKWIVPLASIMFVCFEHQLNYLRH